MRMTVVQEKKPGREFSRRAFRLCLQLDRSDVFCLETFRPLGDVELDCLAFLQAAKAPRLDGRKMHENIVARLTADKAEALGVVKPLGSVDQRLESLELRVKVGAFHGCTPKVLRTTRFACLIALLLAYSCGSIETLIVKISCCSISSITCRRWESYLSK